MRIAHFVVAGTALVSSAALAGGGAKQGELGEQPSEQRAQVAPASRAQAGQSEEVVRQAQEKLTSLGHDAGPADGIAGPKTESAVKEFQQSRGLQVSGRLDTQTLAALQVGPESEPRSMSPSEQRDQSMQRQSSS